MATLVGADLEFELDRPGAASLRGRVSGTGSRLVLDVDDPAAFAGDRDAPVVRAVADELAERGIVVRVVSGGQHLVTLGAVRAPWWQRPFTRSRRIRLGSLRGAWTSARARSTDAASVLPDASLLPPTTLWPLAPTLRSRTATPRTTHDPARGGGARLVLLKERYLPGERQPVFWLRDGLRIGSGPAADVRLPGLEPVHAVLRHDEDDEWCVEPVDGPVRVHGALVESSQLLRTGARVELGEHRLAYHREEFADHGRPHGGRIGGEAGHQRPQPPRPGGAPGPEF